MSIALYVTVLGAAVAAAQGAVGLRAFSVGQFGWRLYFVACLFGSLHLFLRPVVGKERVRWSLVAAGALCLFYGLSDAYLGQLFGRHLEASDVFTGWDALRTGTIPLSPGQRGMVLALFAFCATSSWLLLVLLAWLPRSCWLDDKGPRVVLAAFACGFFLAYMRDLLLVDASAVAEVLDQHAEARNEKAMTSKEHGSRLTDFQLGQLHREQYALLRDLAHLSKLGVAAEKKPDILFVHVESLRFDVFTPELFPQTLSLVGACYRSARHYSTGNASGNGLFGAVTGLSPAYMDLCRAEKLGPTPLRALRELGYHTHVWFPNEALFFDGILAELIGPEMTAHKFSDDAREVADAKVVEAFTRDFVRGGPRFDYVVIDSTHYDYSYPKEFEKFLPADSLGVAFNPKTGEGLISDTENRKARAAHGEGIWNRYRNSVLYADSLLARIFSRRTAVSDRPFLMAVFGDHGESFWDENETFGHSTQLNDPQTRVPFFLCGEPGFTSRYTVTSHADLFPTVFGIMGLTAERPFMSGRNLADYDPGRDGALARMPVTSGFRSSMYAWVGPELRVGFALSNAPTVHWLKDARGVELEGRWEPRAFPLIAQALSSGVLCEPPRAAGQKTGNRSD